MGAGVPRPVPREIKRGPRVDDETDHHWHDTDIGPAAWQLGVSTDHPQG
jgi:hypothetical protein